MKTTTLLTTSRSPDGKALTILDGADEIAAVFGNPKEQDRRAAELITSANHTRLIRSKNTHAKKGVA